jgi:hypothetical protein
MKKMVLILIMAIAVVTVNAQRTPIKNSDLPKAVSEYLTKNLPGYTIKDAVKDVANNVVTYDVTAIKGTAKETLVFDKDGKFVKKVTATTAMVQRKNQAHIAQATHHTNTVVKK